MIANQEIANNCYCAKLRAAARTITRIYDEVFRSMGIKSNQFTVLVATSLLQPVPISQLAKELSMERTTLTRNLLPLEKLGYIRVESGKGRIRNVSITDSGAQLLERAKPLWKDAQGQIISQIGNDKLTTATTTLQQITQT